jgi:EpsI family protein
MVPRIAILIVLLLGATGYAAYASRPEPEVAREPLAALPMQLAEWTGRRAPDFDERTMAVLGVDDYITRVYSAPGGPVGLYVGYYRSQRQGDTIHSPMNCLPGAGWQPVKTGRLTLAVNGAGGAAREIEVNRFVIQKGEERQVVLYWYQSHGRVIASEYWGKVFLVADAVRLNRTDAALVRVISPIERGERSEAAAEARAAAFVRELFPRLSAHLPE